MRANVVSAGEDVKKYVDKMVGHKDWSADVSVTWRQLRVAVDDLSDLYTEVGIFVTGNHHVPRPSVQIYWQQLFQPALFVSQEQVDLLLEGLSEVKSKRAADNYSLQLDIVHLESILRPGIPDTSD